MAVSNNDNEKSTSNVLLLSDSINTYNENLTNPAEPLITVMQVFALAEVAIDKKDLVYWSVGENLSKHRETREFDEHLQKMLLYLDKIGEFQAKEVPCGRCGFYRTLLTNPQTDECILIVHSWDRNAQYMKEYLQMNSDIQNPKFALLQYNLNKTCSNLQSVKFVIPSKSGTAYQSSNLLPLIEQIKNMLPQTATSVNDGIQSLKNELNQIEESTHKINDVQGDA